MVSFAELMGLGVLRSRTTKEPVLKGVLQTAGLGTLAGVVAYGVGSLAHTLS